MDKKRGMLPSQARDEKTKGVARGGKRKQEDTSFWQHFLKDVEPSKKQHDKIVPPLAPLGKTQIRRPKLAVEETFFHAPVVPPLQPLHLQRRQKRQLKYEAALDLHGFTQRDALEKLVRFVEDSYHKGYRCILVITGKGRPAPGVVKNLVMSALADPSLRGVTSGYAEAAQKDGGEGALYIFLRAHPSYL